jgi:hypothetical protein
MDDESLEAGFKPFDSPEVAEAMAPYEMSLEDFLSPEATFIWDESWLEETNV